MRELRLQRIVQHTELQVFRLVLEFERNGVKLQYVEDSSSKPHFKNGYKRNYPVVIVNIISTHPFEFSRKWEEEYLGEPTVSRRTMITAALLVCC
jgi:hypothetical protein